MIIQAMEPSSDSLERASMGDGTQPFHLKLVRRGELKNFKLAYLKFLTADRRRELAVLLPGLDVSTDEPELKTQKPPKL